MGDHYPLCEQYISGDGLPCICDLLSLHADAMEAAAMADLRTAVEALPTRGIGARVVDDELETFGLVERKEVLALLDGGSDE